MKKLLLFALLSSVSAFGQAYSDSVTQNSPGNYGRPVPYASVQVCNIADTATPCTQKVNTFTDDALSVACTQTAGSGVLTGAPSSGANCNNPGIADANGNFTIYVVPGQYRICTYANNWLCQNVSIGGSGGGIPFACASAVNGSIVGMTSTTTSSCDPNGITDFIGHWTSQSYRATGAFNGTIELTGGLADPTNPPDTNSFAFLAPTAVPTPFYLRPPSSVGSVGQCLGLLSQNIGTNGTIDALQWQSCLASATTFQTNGVNNLSQSTLNIVQGANCTVTNASAGDVTVTCTGAVAPPTLSNPSAPTVTPQGVTGATQYCYVIVGCEDGNTCAYHSAATSAGCTTTGNATLTTSNRNALTAYMDTLYGYRCGNVYRTVGGASQGKIATCVDKQWTDTGAAGDATTAPATNTTQTQVTMSPTQGGCNFPMGSPAGGIDALPCTVNASSSEFTDTSGIADTPDPIWSWQNQGSCTATLTGGMVNISCPATGSNALRCLLQTAPATPYTFNSLFYQNYLSSGVGSEVGIAFFESATGKFSTFTRASDTGELLIRHWTSATAASNIFVGATASAPMNGVNYRIRADGTNLIYSSSPDGVIYTQQLTEAKTAGFTTAPDKVGLCVNSNTLSNGDYDYWRRTE